MAFSSPMRPVAVITGAAPVRFQSEMTEAVLTAFDANGNVVLSVRRGPLDENLDVFLGIDADARVITEVRLNYENPSSNPSTEKLGEPYYE